MKHANIYAKLAAVLVKSGAHTATKILSPKHVVRATRRQYKASGKPDADVIEILFTDGPPNVATQELIKQCKRAGEPFPVRKVQLRWRLPARTTASRTRKRRR